MTKRIINPAGLALIKQFEGLRLSAYRDVAGIWTIGYGHTGGVYKGDMVTEAEASYLLAQDLAQSEDWIAGRSQSPTDNQFAAMVSLAFNIGESGFLNSSVRRYHNTPDYPAAADAFLLWDKAHVDGALVTVAGLLDRRIAERTLYLSPNAAPAAIVNPLPIAA
jgi:lysozyme